MTIFFSHSSAQKPLVREIRKLLPQHINSWVDEEKLLIGDALAEKLEKAIKKESDYILLFVDEHTGKSDWIKREISWTLDQEQKMDRSFLLPIVTDTDAWSTLEPAVIRQRKFLKLDDYSEKSVRSLADRITSELFSLICRDIQTLRSPNSVTKAAALDRTDQVLGEIADNIRRIVFSYREAKPLSVDDLRSQLAAAHCECKIDDFDMIMGKIIQSNLIPGLSYDGFDLYVQEEHYRWKSHFSGDAKRRIAKTAASKVRSGHRIALDAGSTTDEVARILCKRIENRSLFNLTVVTISVSAANIFLDSGTRLGFDDDNAAFRLLLPGGRVRPNTLAIVDHGGDAENTNIGRLMSQVGKVDFAFVGVNGIDLEAGFTTHSKSEADVKRTLIKSAGRAMILGDTSKLGIIEIAQFATFADDVTLTIDGDRETDALRTLVAIAPEKIILAKQ